ncbi:MAG: hypothetical protein HOO91_10700 [Bacteroidales bacterium]|nr:hypothetical protein [Bacteroidales bacterium]
MTRLGDWLRRRTSILLGYACNLVFAEFINNIQPPRGCFLSHTTPRIAYRVIHLQSLRD